MTHASDIFPALLAVGGPVLLIVILTAVLLIEWKAIFRKLRKNAEARRADRQLRADTAAVRRITDADLLAAEADLDAWEAEMYANLDAALPESWASAEPVNVGVRFVPEVVKPAWPVPLSPRLTDRADGYAAAQPMPARAEVVLYRPDPSWATIAPTYNGDAAEWRSERLDGQPVVDEQTYAAEVMAGFSRSDSRITNHAALAMSQAFGHVVEAMPVSPAPSGRPRHRHGSAKGTETQRLDPVFISWEQPTGAFALVGGWCAMSRPWIEELTDEQVDPIYAMSHFSCPECNPDGSPEDRSLCGVLLFGSPLVEWSEPHQCPMCRTYTHCPACGQAFRWPS